MRKLVIPAATAGLFVVPAAFALSGSSARAATAAVPPAPVGCVAMANNSVPGGSTDSGFIAVGDPQDPNGAASTAAPGPTCAFMAPAADSAGYVGAGNGNITITYGVPGNEGTLVGTTCQYAAAGGTSNTPAPGKVALTTPGPVDSATAGSTNVTPIPGGGCVEASIG